MVHELLPDVPKLILRPSTVMGDSRFPRDHPVRHDPDRLLDARRAGGARATRTTRLDFVPRDFVGQAIARLHVKERRATTPTT